MGWLELAGEKVRSFFNFVINGGEGVAISKQMVGYRSKSN